jgi:hypothetical protein
MSPAGALKGLACNRDGRAGTFGDLVTCEGCLDLDRNGGTTQGETTMHEWRVEYAIRVSRNSVRAWVLPSAVAHRIGSVPLVAAWAWRTLGLLALVCCCCLVGLWQFDVYVYFLPLNTYTYTWSCQNRRVCRCIPGAYPAYPLDPPLVGLDMIHIDLFFAMSHTRDVTSNVNACRLHPPPQIKSSQCRNNIPIYFFLLSSVTTVTSRIFDISLNTLVSEQIISSAYTTYKKILVHYTQKITSISWSHRSKKNLLGVSLLLWGEEAKESCFFFFEGKSWFVLFGHPGLKLIKQVTAWFGPVVLKTAKRLHFYLLVHRIISAHLTLSTHLKFFLCIFFAIFQ